QQLEPLGRQFGGDVAEAGEVAAGPGETGDQARPDRVADAGEDDRDCRGCAFRRERRNLPWGHDHVDLATDEVSGQCRQPIIVTLRPAVFDRQALSLDVADLTQSLVERGYKQIRRRRRADGAKETDHRHRLLLRTPGGWPSTRCAGEQNDKIASPHARPLALTASRDYGSRGPSRIGRREGQLS